MPRAALRALIAHGPSTAPFASNGRRLRFRQVQKFLAFSTARLSLNKSSWKNKGLGGSTMGGSLKGSFVRHNAIPTEGTTAIL
jgi:hypothetical protein